MFLCYDLGSIYVVQSERLQREHLGSELPLQAKPIFFILVWDFILLYLNSNSLLCWWNFTSVDLCGVESYVMLLKKPTSKIPPWGNSLILSS